MTQQTYAGNLRVSPEEVPNPQVDISPQTQSEPVAVLAGGCFWCVEAALKPLKGVLELTSGYVGDSAQTADYRSVCSGATNHAEAVEVRFDPTQITYGQLLKYFFVIAHDPTQKDRQGNDVGRQYRSEIFYRDSHQKEVAQRYIEQLDAADVFAAPIETRVSPLREFFAGEEYHQDFATRNPDQPYVVHVAAPKAQKMRHYFADAVE